MYINIKLPPEFGSFNRIRKENYPFNTLFTKYLAEISRLGLALGMDVDALVGYIEDRVFDGTRLPDVPAGTSPVNIRYKIDTRGGDGPGALVEKYIGESALTNRMAVMYIARMTLRLSAAYGTSLLRLTRLVTELEQDVPKAHRAKAARQEAAKPEPVYTEPETEEPEAPHAPRVSSRSAARAQEVQERPTRAAADAARAAVDALTGLAEQAGADVVETNPLLGEFM